MIRGSDTVSLTESMMGYVEYRRLVYQVQTKITVNYSKLAELSRDTRVIKKRELPRIFELKMSKLLFNDSNGTKRLFPHDEEISEAGSPPPTPLFDDSATRRILHLTKA